MNLEEKQNDVANSHVAESEEWKPTPIEVPHPKRVDAKDIRLFREPPWRLRMTIERDRSYTKVKVVRAAPLSNPEKYICFLDAKDESICMVDSLKDLTEDSCTLALEELEQRYLTSQVRTVYSIRNEYGVSYWDVETDRGRREFVAKGVAENVQWLGEKRMIILDVDGNRFEVPDLDGLDRKSAGMIEMVL
ncbi:MAG: DUF1854 domain-containing protein [bacterium]|nr:DUF1854 domain-containing protein [bacterium]